MSPSMKAIVNLLSLTLGLGLFVIGCTNASSHERTPTAAKAEKSKLHKSGDSLSSEPQISHIADGNPAPRIARVVCYSYLDIDDYEEDTFTRAPTFQMMPGFSRFFWKYDPHPKVVLTKKQSRRLLAIIGNPKTYKSVQSNCYSPRNCFCFYNSKKEIVGYYQVCFENGRLISVPQFSGSESGTLSESGLKRLRNFCLSAGITVR